ncbi:hypothetical protein CONLIGDRAFT_637539 [Coniochaeta ligniaria NRRL 30616]|uniref:Uncharacterized protein n=1 Tax=Coniochaeta ligniaria NRRL 30616 TaxID=1408157 RepID=A0A1J7I7V8_9PEZI|nr:hypothetical protein CONLIGDRAFT_637539 [Coniochaeta ligniaria NRRL 30616]
MVTRCSTFLRPWPSEAGKIPASVLGSYPPTRPSPCDKPSVCPVQNQCLCQQ